MEMDILNDTETYKTCDLYEASFLYASIDVQHVGLHKYLNKYYFLFRPKMHCYDLSKLYWAKQGTIAPLALTEAIRTLKDLIYSKGASNALQ